MATYIKGFWARICGFLVGVISTIFGSNSAQAITVESRVYTCDDQDFDGFYSPYGDAEGDTSVYGSGNLYFSGDFTIDYSNGVDLQSAWNDLIADGNFCNPACGCDASSLGDGEECFYPWYYTSRQHLVNNIPAPVRVSSNGFTGYSVPMFVGASYIINNDNELVVVGFCYNLVNVVDGCGYDGGGSAGIVIGKLSDGRGSYLTNKSTKKFVGASTFTYTGTSRSFTYAGNLSNIWADNLANSATKANVQCSSCAIPSGATAGMVGYGGSTTAGNTFSTDKCYFIAKGSQSGMTLLSDTSGSFYYPLANGSLNKCYYNQNSGNGVTSST